MGSDPRRISADRRASFFSLPTNSPLLISHLRDAEMSLAISALK